MHYFKLFLTASLLHLLIVGSMQAQVVMGSGLLPNQGALLDLKEFESSTTDLKNANKGLLLPRVSLEALDQLPPENATFTGDAIHIGLLVYNLKEDPAKTLCKGVHVWMGTTWENISNRKCGVINDCELTIIGSNGTTYYLYCEEFLGTQSEAIDICKTRATNPNKAYHLVTEAEYVQIWNRSTVETGVRLFVNDKTYHLTYEGWVTAANIKTDASTIVGVGFPFSGGTPIGGVLTGTRSVRCVRD